MRTKRAIGLIVVACLLASVTVLGLLIAWLGSALGPSWASLPLSP
jgi:hypothetical protein